MRKLIGLLAVLTTCLVAGALSAQTTFATTSTLPAAVPDNSATGVTLDIPVAGLAANVIAVTMQVTFNPGHSFLGDLIINLRAPASVATADIINEIGAANENSDFVGPYTFVDGGANFTTAAAAVGATVAVPSGSYAASTAGGGPVTLNTVFGGLTPAQANGTWQVNFADTFTGDTGSVSALSITITEVGTNVNPAISVVRDAGGTPVTIINGGSTSVVMNSTVATLDLEFSVTDANTGDVLDLVAQVNPSANIAGFVQAEWDAGPSATQPLVAAPSSGTFGTVGAITVQLDADDNVGGTATFTFTINVFFVTGTTITVTNLNDAGAGSLREAVDFASPTAPGNDIVFQTGLTGTITLATQLVVNKPLTITGPTGSPGITVSGNNTVRCFFVGQAAPAAASLFSITNLTVANGRGGLTTNSGGGFRVGNALMALTLTNVTVTGCNTAAAAGFGAGLSIVVNSAISITGCTFSNNVAVQAGGGISVGASTNFTITDTTFSGNTATNNQGGALDLESVAGATYTITGCTFNNNTSNLGAGVSFLQFAAGAAILNMTNCTLSTNNCPGTNGGAGLLSGGTVAGAAGTVNLSNCTVANNTAAAGSTASSLLAFGNVAGAIATITYQNTIIVGASTANIGGLGAGTIVLTSLNNNLCSDGTGNLTGANDLPNTPGNLGALANNGGTTQTHMPQPGSASIDNGRFIAGTTTDQRGVAKPIDDSGVTNASNGDGSDIGSVEAPSSVAGDQEIEVRRGGTPKPDASTDTLAAPLLVAAATSITWDIFNLGATDDLDISARTAAATGVMNCNVTITSGAAPFAITAAGQSALDIDVTPTAIGPFEFTITITSDDADEGTYTIIVQGIAITNAPPTLTLSAGTTFAAGANFDLALDPGVTLNQADLDVDDATPDPVDLTIVFVTGPMGATPPNNITMTANQTIAATSLPFTISWTGTVDANDDPGAYSWLVTLDDGVSVVTSTVRLIINDLDPTHTPATSITGDGLSGASSYTASVAIGAAGAVSLCDCDDANLSQSVTFVSATPTGSPSALVWNFAMVGTNPATLQATPAAAPGVADVGPFDYTVIVEDDNNNQTTIFVTLDVFGTAPNITSGLTPTTAVDGVPFSHQFTATGNPAPTFAVTAGSLAGTWATLTPAGLLSGTPVLGQNIGITVSAQNGIASDDTEVVTITVVAGVPPTITSAAAPTTATVGVLYTHTFTATGTPTPTLSAVGVPAWLTFTPATGVLSGTPAAGDVGTAGPITVTAANGVAPDATEVFSIIVSAAPTTGGGKKKGEEGCSTDDTSYGWMILLGLLSMLVVASRARRVG